MGRRCRTVTGVRAGRAGTLIRMVDQGEIDVLRFIRAGARVHVVSVDKPANNRVDALMGDDTNAMFRLLLGEEWSVCGLRFVRHRGGFEQGAQLVGHFPDDDLCPHCHAAFGDRGVLIFEANTDDYHCTTLGGLHQ